MVQMDGEAQKGVFVAERDVMAQRGVAGEMGVFVAHRDVIAHSTGVLLWLRRILWLRRDCCGSKGFCFDSEVFYG